jgi:phosphomannomutase
VSGLVEAAPRYSIVKAKVPRRDDLAPIYQRLQSRFADATADSRDGLRLAWPGRWVHLRPSGTEPVIRIIAEAATVEDAEALVSECRNVLDA